MLKKLCAFFVVALVFISVKAPVYADGPAGTTYKNAVIKEIENKDSIVQQLAGFTTQKITLTYTGSDESDEKEVVIEDSRLPNALAKNLKPGDEVILAFSNDPQAGQLTYIADYKRTNQLVILAGIFLAVVIAIGRWQGFASFVGMIISFFVIIRLIIPQILLGTHPVVAALLGGLIIIPVTFYMSHGLNKKTSIGIVGTLISLTITGILAGYFVSFARITGFADEDASFVQLMTGGSVDITSLLLAGIMIGAMGILDDITISQTSIVERLHTANKKYGFKKLYKESMIVGRDHIASLVNTLVLVYAGASLPLFVLFVTQDLALQPVINHELVATEVVRTLVSSIGIVLAVPITSFIASYATLKYKK